MLSEAMERLLPQAFEIYPLQPEHIPELVGMSTDFFAEGDSEGLTYDPVGFTEYLFYSLDRDSERCVVAEHRDELCGYLMWVERALFTEEPLAQELLFYVHPKFRRSGCGVVLLDAAIRDAKSRGVPRFYASTAAGVGSANDRRLLNLYRKFGFNELGSAVCLKMED